MSAFLPNVRISREMYIEVFEIINQDYQLRFVNQSPERNSWSVGVPPWDVEHCSPLLRLMIYGT
ncbi:hypothetical protein ACT691_16435 [Vibrio metschnikovii]